MTLWHILCIYIYILIPSALSFDVPKKWSFTNVCDLTGLRPAAHHLALIKSVKNQANKTRDHIVSKVKAFFNRDGQATAQEAAHRMKKQADSILDIQNLETRDVTVVVRVRPLSLAGHQEGATRALVTRGNTVALYNSSRYTDNSDNKGQQPQDECSVEDNDSWGAPRVFTFDAVMPESCKTDEIFSLIGYPAVMEVCRGVSALVFAFGQTGSGKTYTLLGSSQGQYAEGVATLTFQHLRRQLDEHKGLDKEKDRFEYNIQVSAVQIYLNRVYDLLSSEETVLRIRAHKTEASVSQLGGEICMLEPKETSKPCNSTEEFQQILQDMALKRVQNKTKMNDTSSRSHLVLTLAVMRTVPSSRAKVNKQGNHDLAAGRGHVGEPMSKLVLVDLAGNERDLARSGLANELSLKQEGIDINLSLSALSTCLRERAARSSKLRKPATHTSSQDNPNGDMQCGTDNEAAKQKQVENEDNHAAISNQGNLASGGVYRRSALTRLLKGNLSHAKIFFLACCSPAASSAPTTGQTLEYAALVKRIKTNAEDTALLMERHPDSFPIKFLPLKALVESKRIPRSSEGKTVYVYELRAAVVRVMLSHRWLSPNFDHPDLAHPDDEKNHKLALVRELFARLCARGWIRSSDQIDIVCWVDYGKYTQQPHELKFHEQHLVPE
jgi:hypothetical protein